MKRDMGLVRELLLRVEARPLEPGTTYIIGWDDELFELSDYGRDDAINHFHLMVEEGFIEPGGRQGMSDFVIRGLSWKGHDFLDTVRSPDVWKRTTEATKKIGGVGFDLLVGIAKAEAKRFAIEKLGLQL